MIVLKVLLVLALMAASYYFGKFEGIIRGQAATLAFLEQSIKGIIRGTIRELRQESSDEDLL
jgi:hypothetical protein